MECKMYHTVGTMDIDMLHNNPFEQNPPFERNSGLISQN